MQMLVITSLHEMRKTLKVQRRSFLQNRSNIKEKIDNNKRWKGDPITLISSKENASSLEVMETRHS